MSNHQPPIQKPSHPSSKLKLSTAAKITTIYLGVGFLWIFYSDRLLSFLVNHQIDTVTYLQTTKGWFYVIATACLLYWLISRETRVSQSANKKLKKALAELQTTQTALKHSEERFRVMVEEAFDPVSIIDPSGRIIYISPNSSGFLGNQPEAILDTQWNQNIHPDDAPSIATSWKTLLEQPLTKVRTTCQMRHQDGTWRWIEGTARNLTNHPAIAGIVINWRDVTEQQTALRDRDLAEIELRQRERLFSTLAEASPVAIFRFDTANNCVYVNNRWRDLTGHPVETALGLGWVEALHPDDRDRLASEWLQWCQHAQQKGLYQNEGRCLRPDQSEIWFYIQALAEVDTQGETVGYIGVLTDITHLKQTETALAASQLQLQQQLAEIETIYRFAPIGLNVLDRDLCFIRINQHLADINGLSVEAHIGRTIREVLPALADTAEQLLRPILETGEPLWNIEITGETPAQPGVQRTWLEHFLPLKNGDRVIGINTVCEEITERKRTEELLHLREQQFRQAILNAPYPMILHAEDGEVVQINQVWTELTGYEPDDIPTIADWTEKAYGHRMEMVQAAIDKLYSLNTRVYEGEFNPRTKDGKQRIWDFSSAPVGKLPDGRRLVLSMAADITDRKQAEKHLRAALAEKEVLLKEIHHRVKNNLQIVSGLLQLQAQSLDDEQVVEALKESQNRVEAMSLIHKKLYTSSDLGQVDVADYVHSLAISLMTTYQIQPGQIALEVDVEPIALCLDHAIPCGLIINELVSNALKYAFPENPCGEINIKLCQTQASFELTIQDNGIGLPADLDWQNAQSLGLSLVYALATEQLEGSLAVDYNQGTAFTIKFPKVLPQK